MADAQPTSGILEIHDKGYGFLRVPNKPLSNSNTLDVFIPPDMIKRNGLRDGAELGGTFTVNGRGPQMVELQEINAKPVLEHRRRIPFEELTVINPNRWIKLETTPERLSTRVVDLMTPIGHGQRALIVAPPRSGKTMLMQSIAEAVAINSPETFLMVVLVDERPEEVTDFKRFIHGKGELWSSSNDQDVNSHTRLSKLVIERAKRLCESGKDVFILLDSLTRLGRAFNAITRGTRTMSGGMDSRAMEIPRRLFAAARQTEEAGSITIVATALIDTNNKGDELIFQEFKGTGNCEIVLERKLAEMRLFPAIDIEKSGTRREELLLAPDILDRVNIIRRGLAGTPVYSQMDRLLSMIRKAPSNKAMLDMLPASNAVR
ncbi:transcription termination factor Rho [Verrucomicrobia bacterium LW23]|nr:transcription termination factor Rho [Verrucomicrobia bacterium LW23]